MSKSGSQESEAEMADEQAQAQRTANLARIRDNQRRSRARRKEYLQELEEKYRQCEQMGVEASAEIQAAARRVVDENKRLRQLLKQQGLSDVEIDRMTAESPDNSQYPTAASALESMIEQRRPCVPSASAGNRQPSSTPALVAQSGQGQEYRFAQGQRLVVPPQLGAPQPAYASPRSSGSSSVQTPNTQHFPTVTHALPYSVPASTLPPMMDYGMQYSAPFVWQSSYTTTQASQRPNASAYVTADGMRAIKPDIGFDFDQDMGEDEGRGAGEADEQMFNLMDRYPSDGGHR